MATTRIAVLALLVLAGGALMGCGGGGLARPATPADGGEQPATPAGGEEPATTPAGGTGAGGGTQGGGTGTGGGSGGGTGTGGSGTDPGGSSGGGTGPSGGSGGGTGGGTGGGDSGGSGSDPGSPASQEAEKTWTISAAQLGATATRSEPYGWDRITAANAGAVRVSIGGKTLPFTSTASAPAFPPGASGAEWTVQAEVSAGSVVLALSAPSVRVGGVASVTVTSGGVDYYLAVPAVTFSPPPPGGVRATGVAAGPGQVSGLTVVNRGGGYISPATVQILRTVNANPGQPAAGSGAAFQVTMNNYVSGLGLVFKEVASVTVTSRGSGYFGSGHYAQFSAPSSGFGGTRALGNLGVWETVRSVTVTKQGSGYMSAPTISFSGGGGERAAARAVMRWLPGTTDVYNLNAARAALYGKELRVWIEEE